MSFHVVVVHDLYELVVHVHIVFDLLFVAHLYVVDVVVQLFVLHLYVVVDDSNRMTWFVLRDNTRASRKAGIIGFVWGNL